MQAFTESQKVAVPQEVRVADSEDRLLDAGSLILDGHDRVPPPEPRDKEVVRIQLDMIGMPIPHNSGWLASPPLCPLCCLVPTKMPERFLQASFHLLLRLLELPHCTCLVFSHSCR